MHEIENRCERLLADNLADRERKRTKISKLLLHYLDGIILVTVTRCLGAEEVEVAAVYQAY